MDEKRLPGCTNGVWSLRVKITDPEKIIPSYIHRRDEGELWSLNFEGRIFCCWKCGSGGHIGDKCKDQTRTFEEVFNASDENFLKPTWAAVVRSGNVQSEEQEKRAREIELQIKEDNKKKREYQRQTDYVLSLQQQQIERQQAEDLAGRQAAIEEVGAEAAMVMRSTQGKSNAEGTEVSDDVLARLDSSPETITKISDEIARGVMNGAKVGDGLEDTSDKLKTGGKNSDIDGELNIVFGPGASLMSLEQSRASDKSISSAGDNETSTPLRDQSRGRRRSRGSGRNYITSPSPVRPRLDPSLDPGGGQDVALSDIGKVSDQGQQGDLLDPGDNKGVTVDVQKELSDSGDWGDSFNDGLEVHDKVDVESLEKDGQTETSS